MLDETHDGTLTSWIGSANAPEADFPVQNLPFGVFRRRAPSGAASLVQRLEAPRYDSDAASRMGEARVGVAIGDQIVDLSVAAALGVFDDAPDGDLVREAVVACEAWTLNPLMALGRAPARALRVALSRCLRIDGPDAPRARDVADRILVPMAQAELLLPVDVGDYTDFYASIHHATLVGSLFRPDNPLLPNYKWVPIGYHGRSSSIVVSGTPVRRPMGQRKGPDDSAPSVGPSRSLDYELELGVFVAGENAMGTPIPIGEADAHVFGVVIVNDWSARDVQSWEYQPLGPFLGKNFATSISPWVVTMDALIPFRVPRAARAGDDPAPLAYLDDAQDRAAGGLDITLEVSLRTAAMRSSGEEGVVISHGSSAELYWTFAQMLAHHTMNGCPMRPGDLFASGTISGATRDARGCLLEMTRRGAEPLVLPNGETRKFLEDGDEVVMTAWAERPGFQRIGLGRCGGAIVA
ncbi:MAG: fumarylacetoacetase [Gemmatimonadaceae bacterium]|nr:fumarylacetoacetase [Gemmatimonadaceae bacterium]